MVKMIQLLQEENEEVLERMELSKERLSEIVTEETVTLPCRSYFHFVAKFLLLIYDIAEKNANGSFSRMSESELIQLNEELYRDILPEHYETSYANPTFACEQFGSKYGKVLAFLYTEIRSLIPCAFEYRLMPIAVTSELFIEIYNYFEEENEFTYKDVKRAIYYFAHDYSEDYIEARMRETSDPTYTFAYDIIMNSDLDDLRYLYQYGDYITENEREIAKFLKSLPEEDVRAMADTYTEGYIRGFQVMGADLSKKSIVGIRTVIGFERMMRCAIENFEKIGKQVVVYRVAIDTINKKPGRKIGYSATSPNLQYEYDHRYDKGIYFDANYKERVQAATKIAYEKYKMELIKYAGPAVLETFGEPDFNPINKEEAIRLDAKQQELNTELANNLSMLANEYMKSEEISFTIIAYPLPSIGKQFKEIFAETVKVNTLDNEKYKAIQQHLIDALDEGVSVRILGGNGNKTDMMVSLYELKDKSKETIFENCTADVNIPVGEVFTSPRLTGTNGCLNVTKVFLNGLEYRDLEIEFRDGYITSYTCSNFEKDEEKKQFIKENILMNRETLPLGEFAIGTNTTAYMMGRKFDIQKKLPSLIAEKTGPHFAVGDTCYSHSEDHKVYNPDGKEIVARDNECSILRKTDISKAYVNCHTDITIPYDEIQKIAVVKADGTEINLIFDGKFVLPGTEELNKAFKQ
ncbi:MAG: aminopeptidase [Clostridiales bacterium]|nr:aminopeptidase [Clostridiales bacterium]